MREETKMDKSKMIDLNDLAKVTGGLETVSQNDPDERLVRVSCPYCHDIFRADITKPYITCSTCHNKIEPKGSTTGTNGGMNHDR